MRLSSMKLKVGDTNWKVRLLTPEQFIDIHGEENKETAAMTDTGTHIIDFRNDCIDIINVRHELFHAYFSLSLVSDSHLDKDATEELSANIIGKYGEQLVNNSKKVYKYIVGKNEEK